MVPGAAVPDVGCVGNSSAAKGFSAVSFDRALPALLPINKALHAVVETLVAISLSPVSESKRILVTLVTTLLWWLSSMVGVDPRNVSKKLALITTLLTTVVARVNPKRRASEPGSRLEEVEISDKSGGNAAALVVVGDAGIGKTALIDALREHQASSSSELILGPEGGLATPSPDLPRLLVVVWSALVTEKPRPYAARWRDAALRAHGRQASRMVLVCNRSDEAPCPMPDLQAMGEEIPTLAVSALRGTNVAELWDVVAKELKLLQLTSPDSVIREKVE